MTMLLDQLPVDPDLSSTATLADALAWAQKQLPAGRMITRIQLDGDLLEGDAIGNARSTVLAGKTLALASTDKRELSLSMIGRLAALIEWLAPQHKQAAAMLERGEQAGAFDALGRIFATWQNIQSAYGNLARMNDITLATLRVRQLRGEALLNEFCAHLAEMQTALQKHDLVLLADILQYEMDGAVANWMSLLESTLAVVQGESVEAGPTR